MDLTDLIKAISERKEKTRSYDTTAVVRRIEGRTAWVHIPGGVDETPVKMTIKAAPGDTVQVRISGGQAWITGNATAPPTDDTLAMHATRAVQLVEKVVSKVKEVADSAQKIAGNTNQYFWHTEEGSDTGAHITELPQEEFLDDPDNGGGNLLARSNGIAIRNGLTELATFGSNFIELAKNSTASVIRMCAGKLAIHASYSGAALVSQADYDDDSYNPTYCSISMTATHSRSGYTDRMAGLSLIANAGLNLTRAVVSADQLLLNGGDFHLGGDFYLGAETAISDWGDFLKYSTDTITNANDAPKNTIFRLNNSHGVSNAPVSNACFLITIGSSSTNKIQFCTAANVSTYELYMRKCSGGSWGSWKSITFS